MGGEIRPISLLPFSDTNVRHKLAEARHKQQCIPIIYNESV